MNSKRKSSFLYSGVLWAAATCPKFFLAALLLLCASCSGRGPAATPVPQVFDAPTAEISTFTTLTLLSKDDPSHAHWVDFFGESVDIDGDVLVSGAPRSESPPGEGTGAAHVFRRSFEGEWRAEATLIASDRDDGFQYDQHFGAAVALNGKVIAVGAPGYDDPQAGDNTGAVYIFEYNGRAWVETGKLTPSRRKPGAKIGTALALDGDLLAVSGSPEAGSVCIFQREAGEWREMTQVPVPSSSDGEPYNVLMDLYGGTLALSMVTQQPPEDEHDEQAVIQSLRTSGTVTLYERAGDEWKKTFQTAPQEASLYRMDGGAFGLPVSLGGEAGKANLLAVGKPGFPGSGREVGSVAIYERGERGWELQAELMLAPGEQIPGALTMIFSEPEPGAAFFGASVELEGNRLAVVSTFANTVYVFERQGPGWVYRFRITPGADYGDDFQRRTVAQSGSDLLLGSPGELGGGYVFVFNLSP